MQPRGEAAQMELREEPQEGYRREYPVPTQAIDVHAEVGYYGLPLVKQPVWVAAVPVYFWLGGAAGAAATLASVARLAGGPRLARLARRARWLAAAGDVVGAALLTLDLGRPQRFINMLRVLNVRSPMSVGSWVLAGSGAANAGALLLEERRGLLGALGGLAGAAGGMLGMPLAGYTAVLLSNTAVPVWREGRRSLPFVFMASGVATAGSLLALAAKRDGERTVAQRFALAGQMGELAATAALHAEVTVVGETVAAPLRRGLSGRLLTAATGLTAASVAVSLLAGRRSRRGRRVAAVLGALGSLALRFALHEAGKASARDPAATFAAQRASGGGSGAG
jgi:formate-dependent nitrite reductase membrane component NrfD